MRKLSRLLLSCALTFPAVLSAGAQATGITSGVTAPASAADEPTVDQFHTYLRLSGIGEAWRLRWIAALDRQRPLMGAPYWPESFWTDARSAMEVADIAPSAWKVYRATYSKQTMERVNLSLQQDGLKGFVASPLGQDFCSTWATKESQGMQETLALTQFVLGAVYQKHADEIHRARVAYLKAHPEYKDPPLP